MAKTTMTFAQVLIVVFHQEIVIQVVAATQGFYCLWIGLLESDESHHLLIEFCYKHMVFSEAQVL
jgi:hypothetical protein